MKNLIQLVKIVTNKRLRKIEVLNDVVRGKSKNNYYKFYQGLKTGRYTSDEDAAMDILDTDPGDKKYLMLKSRLKRKLFNNLFFLDENKYESDFFKAYYKSYRNMFVAKTLRAHGARHMSIELFQKTLGIAKEYEFTTVVIECLNELRYNSSLEGSEKDLYFYDDQIQYYEDLLKAENRAQVLWEKLLFKFVRTTAKESKNIEIAREYSKLLQGLKEKFDSFTIHYIYYRVVTRYYNLAKDYPQAIEICDRAEKELNKYPHLFDKIKLADFLTNKIISYLHIKDFDNGKETAEYCLKLYSEGSNNWLFFQEIYFLMAMQTKNYTKGQEIYQTVTQHPRFDQIPDARKEKWRIFEAYLRYALNRYFKSYEEAEEKPGFKINKFLNEVPIYSKDKKGLNVAILIIQILYYLEYKRYDNIIDRMGALKQYSNRYLQKGENYRSSVFIKMLQIMEKESFDYDRTKQLAQEYYQKLLEAQMQFDGNMEGLEIIPFEKLWQNILHTLESHSDSRSSALA